MKEDTNRKTTVTAADGTNRTQRILQQQRIIQQQNTLRMLQMLPQRNSAQSYNPPASASDNTEEAKAVTPQIFKQILNVKAAGNNLVEGRILNMEDTNDSDAEDTEMNDSNEQSNDGSNSILEAVNTSTTAGTPIEDKKKKEKLKIIIMVLTKYLERDDKALLRRFTAVFLECREKNENDTSLLKSRLRQTVGDQYWNKALKRLKKFEEWLKHNGGSQSDDASLVANFNRYLHYLKQKRSQKQSSQQPPNAAIPSLPLVAGGNTNTRMDISINGNTRASVSAYQPRTTQPSTGQGQRVKVDQVSTLEMSNESEEEVGKNDLETGESNKEVEAIVPSTAGGANGAAAIDHSALDNAGTQPPRQEHKKGVRKYPNGTRMAWHFQTEDPSIEISCAGSITSCRHKNGCYKYSVLYDDKEKATGITEKEMDECVAYFKEVGHPILTGILSSTIQGGVRKQLFQGQWQWATEFSSGSFEYGHLSGDTSRDFPQDGEFKGSFSGDSDEEERVEEDFKLAFEPKEDGTFIVKGEGTNEFLTFELCGTATKQSKEKGDPTYSIVLTKSYGQSLAMKKGGKKRKRRSTKKGDKLEMKSPKAPKLKEALVATPTSKAVEIMNDESALQFLKTKFGLSCHEGNYYLPSQNKPLATSLSNLKKDLCSSGLPEALTAISDDEKDSILQWLRNTNVNPLAIKLDSNVTFAPDHALANSADGSKAAEFTNRESKTNKKKYKNGVDVAKDFLWKDVGKIRPYAGQVIKFNRKNGCYSIRYGNGEEETDVSEEELDKRVAYYQKIEDTIMSGTLSSSSQGKHTFDGKWDYCKYENFFKGDQDPQEFKFTRSRDLKEFPSDGEFSGSFDICVESAWERKAETQSIAEDIKLTFKSKEDTIGTFVVDGTGKNKYGTFELFGIATKNIKKRADGIYSIELFKRYIVPAGSDDSARKSDDVTAGSNEQSASQQPAPTDSSAASNEETTTPSSNNLAEVAPSPPPPTTEASMNPSSSGDASDDAGDTNEQLKFPSEPNAASAPSEKDTKITQLTEEVAQLQAENKMLERKVTSLERKASLAVKGKVQSKADGGSSSDDNDQQQIRKSLEGCLEIPTPHTPWSHIIGNDEVKEELKSSIPACDDDDLGFIHEYDDREQKISCILMYGYAGTGKTLFAKALATASNGSFMSVNSNNILSEYHGVSEKRMQAVFDIASDRSIETGDPTILFFDEIDGILGKPGHNDGKVENNIIKIFQTCIEGAKECEGKIIVVAATNYLSKLPPPVLSRFHTKLAVNLPVADDITDIIKYWHKKLGDVRTNLTNDDYQSISEKMMSMSAAGRDTRDLVKKAIARLKFLSKKAKAGFWCKDKDGFYVPCPHGDAGRCEKKTFSEAKKIGELRLPPLAYLHYEYAIKENKKGKLKELELSSDASPLQIAESMAIKYK